MIGFINICHPDYADETAIGLGKTAAAFLRSKGTDIYEYPETVTDHKSAHLAARAMIEREADGIIIFYGAFVLCSTVMCVVDETRLPVLQWAVPMMERGGLLSTTGSYVALSMFNGTLNRLEIPHVSLIAEPEAEEAAQRAADFSAAAAAAKKLHRTRVGLVGYTSMSIYPGTFDHVLMRWMIGPEAEHFDSYTLINRAEAVKDTDAVLKLYGQSVDFPKNAPAIMKERAAKLYVALKELCEEHDLQAITVKCQYEFSKEYGMTPCMPLSLLADNGIITSCEGDMPCLISCVILKYLSGETASYGDAIHHDGDLLKLSPCGYMPFSMGNPGKKASFVSQYPFFKGILCSFVMRPGRVTVLRLVENKGSFSLLYFTGTAVESELRGGNMPSVDIRLDGDINTLIDKYPGQHFAICYGDISERISMLADFLGIKTETI